MIRWFHNGMNYSSSFFSSELEENEIEEIQEIELRFHIFGEDSWEDSFETELVTIQVK